MTKFGILLLAASVSTLAMTQAFISGSNFYTGVWLMLALTTAALAARHG
jgi:hypothetical protein